MTDSMTNLVVKRLREACDGHPHAKIEWPHRILHDGADEIERLTRCIKMAMGCLDPLSREPDERLAWYRLKDAIEGREPRDSLTHPSTLTVGK